MPLFEDLDNTNSIDICPIAWTIAIDGNTLDHYSQISIYHTKHRTEVPRNALQACLGSRVVLDSRECALYSDCSHVVASQPSVPPWSFQGAQYWFRGKGWRYAIQTLGHRSSLLRLFSNCILRGNDCPLNFR